MFPQHDQPWPADERPSAALCAEADRMAVLASYGLDAFANDPELTAITEFAAKLCSVPIVLVSIVEEERQRFLARSGLDATETPRSVSFCASTMLSGEPMIVPDTLEDERFADNALVTGDPFIRFYAGVPLVSPEGAPLGALCAIDTAPRPGGLTDFQLSGMRVLAASVMRRLEMGRLDRSATTALSQSEEQFRILADNIPDIVWAARPDGTFDYFNRRWFEFVGDHVDPADNFADVFHPDDRDRWYGDWQHARRSGERYETEFRLREVNGGYRWFLVRGEPVVDEDGAVVRWFGTGTDIDAERRMSQARELLSRELSHRITNIFAVIASLVSMKARHHDDVAEFAADLNGTVKSLGLANNYVFPDSGQKRDTMSELLRDLLDPYDISGRQRITVNGNNQPISAKSATPLALIFHELATNSAKYGALACDTGTVTVDIGKDGSDVLLAWQENSTTCSPVTIEEREGFGSRLLRMSVEGQLQGSFERTFTDTGLHVEFRFAEDRIAGTG